MPHSDAGNAPDQDSAIAVFTAKTVERILEEGGSSSWVLDSDRAKRCRYLVCTRNSRVRDEEWTGGESSEPHQAAFLVGRVNNIVPSPKRPGRQIVQINEYAIIEVLDAWKGWRNPVLYTNLQAFGLDASALKWKPMPELVASDNYPPKPNVAHSESTVLGERAPLTILQAKQGLSATFSVPLDAIEIIIRG